MTRAFVVSCMAIVVAGQCGCGRKSALIKPAKPDLDKAVLAQPVLSPAFVSNGWEILSVSAVRRPTITSVSTEYVESKPVATHESPEKPTKGVFVIVEVRYKCAGSESPKQDMWLGRGHSVLVDEKDKMFAAGGVLKLQGDDYRLLGGAEGVSTERANPSREYDCLVYFDVPTRSRNFRLALGKQGPLAKVSEAGQ